MLSCGIGMSIEPLALRRLRATKIWQSKMPQRVILIYLKAKCCI